MLRTCCNWLFFLVKLVLFLWLSLAAKDADLWHFLTQYPVGCAHEPLPGNHSGIKVLVLGLAKSGTRTICHALNELGLRAYHSEDFHFLPWWDFIHELREEPLGAYANLSQPYVARELNKDQQLANRMMQKISKCRMEAVALDGLEVLMEPLAKANPNAKVVMLNWRSFPQWRKSLDVFTPKLVVLQLASATATEPSGLPPEARWLWMAVCIQVLQLAKAANDRVPPAGGQEATQMVG